MNADSIALRRQFSLREEDVEYLEARGLSWETIIDNNQHWLIMHDYPVPSGYNHEMVRAAVILGSCYPHEQIDMVYFAPHLTRLDGKQINNLSDHPLDGQTYQRWSRHRTDCNPWRVGVDDLATHMTLVDYWLQREFHIR